MCHQCGGTTEDPRVPTNAPPDIDGAKRSRPARGINEKQHDEDHGPQRHWVVIKCKHIPNHAFIRSVVIKDRDTSHLSVLMKGPMN